MIVGAYGFHIEHEGNVIHVRYQITSVQIYDVILTDTMNIE